MATSNLPKKILNVYIFRKTVGSQGYLVATSLCQSSFCLLQNTFIEPQAKKAMNTRGY